MPNNYLLVLYKHIIQVENENVGLKGGGGGGPQTYHCPPPPPLPTPVLYHSRSQGPPNIPPQKKQQQQHSNLQIRIKLNMFWRKCIGKLLCAWSPPPPSTPPRFSGHATALYIILKCKIGIYKKEIPHLIPI